MIDRYAIRWMLCGLLCCAVLAGVGIAATRAAAPEPAFVPKDICPGTCSSSPRNLAVGDNLLFFEAKGADGVYRPWVSDGTPTGTITNTLGPNGSAISPPVNIAGTWYFAADDGPRGTELWSRPAAGGTPTLVKNIAVSNSSSAPRALTDVAGTLLFVADDGINGAELWRSDGTDAGTTLVKDINPAKEGMNNGADANISPERFVIGNKLLFAADDGSKGLELWASDGSPTGTLQLKDINSGAGDSIDTRAFVSAGNRVFFRANQDNGKVGLWTSDGTPTGTVKLKERSGSNAASEFTQLAAGNGRAFFIISGDPDELWVSDGTVGGTKKVVELDNFPPQYLTVVNGVAFFNNSIPEHGGELWKSDGTPAGTSEVKDIRPGNIGSSLIYLTDIFGKLIFSASDGVHGTEVWQSDGTTAGTTLLADVAPGIDVSNPSLYTPAGKFLFFAANGSNGTVGRELWAIPRYVITGEPPPDPTAEPTAVPPEPTTVPGEPTAAPTLEPGQPTPEPTTAPGEPTPEPTFEPGQPTPEPTLEPTPEPGSYARFLPLVQGR